jgi:hypothetical protein
MVLFILAHLICPNSYQRDEVMRPIQIEESRGALQSDILEREHGCNFSFLS